MSGRSSMNLPTKEELEAEMVRQRQDASERKKRSDSFSRSAAFLILPMLVLWAGLCFSVLYAFSEWQKIIKILAIIGVLIVVAGIVLKINKKKGSPCPPYSIVIALQITIAAVLALLVKL